MDGVTGRAAGDKKKNKIHGRTESSERGSTILLTQVHDTELQGKGKKHYHGRTD